MTKWAVCVLLVAAGCSSAQSLHKLHQADGGAPLGGVMEAAHAIIRSPVHAFRLAGKLIQHARTTAQPHSNLLRLPEPPLMGRFLLARVSEAVAMAAREQSPGTVELGDAATAIHSVCSNRTHKPGPFSTEPARRPGDGDPLLDIAPILAIRTASVFQQHVMMLGFDVDGRHPLALPGPGP